MRRLSIPRVVGDTPLGVWAVTLMTGAIILVGTFLQPLLKVPDERFHVDMIFAGTSGHGWPEVQERVLSSEVAAANRIVRRNVRDTSLALAPRPDDPRAPACRPAQPIPECNYKPTFQELQATYDYLGPVNRMTQHPPAYYLLAGFSVSTFTTLAMRTVPFDGQLWLYRLVSLLLILPLPFLISLALRELRASRPVQVAAAALPTAVVGLTLRNAAIVNNDNLLVPVTAGISLLLVVLCTRGVTTRRLVILGALLGLALITKGTALLTAIAIPPALYLLHAGPLRQRIRRTAHATLVVAGSAFVFGGWWPVRNIVLYGTPQPKGMGRGAAPADFVPDVGYWFTRYWSQVTKTGLGRTGHDLLGQPLVLVAGVLLLLAAIVIGTRALGWRHSLVINLPLIVTVLAWSGTTYMNYARTGVASAANARYYYPLLLGFIVLLAVAADRVVRSPRAATVWPAVTAALVVLVSARQILDQLRLRWSDERSVADGLEALSRWAPAPVAFFYAGLGLAAIGLMAMLILASGSPRPANIGEREHLTG